MGDVDSAIAAALADEPADSPAETEQPDEQKTEADGEQTEGERPEDESSEETETENETEAPAFDADKIKAAIEKKDLGAFIEAIGKEAADQLLGGKAHKTLRLQLRDAKNAEAKAVKLSEQLSQEFGDAIAARKASAEGNVDAFLEMIEKWAGRDWNDIQKWVVGGIAGRKERLEAKAKDDKVKQDKDTDAQAKALEETRTWVGSSLKKADPKITEKFPELVDMVIDEMRSGLAKGIDSPAKALPLVKAKLKERYERMHSYFGDGRRNKAPVVKPTNRVNVNTKPMSRDELIASILKEER